MPLFSRRNQVLEPFRYDLPEHVRNRILCTIEQSMAQHCQNFDLEDMLLETRRQTRRSVRILESLGVRRRAKKQ
jgi:hypothetical protein